MSDLRLILLGLGVSLIVAIWLWSRYARRRAHPSRAAALRAKSRRGARRGGTARGAGPGKNSGAARARRGETLALDLELGDEDDEPEVPPLGLGFPDDDGAAEGGGRTAVRGAPEPAGGDKDRTRRGARGRISDTSASTRQRGERGAARAAFQDESPATPEGSSERPSPSDAWSAGGLEGLRATRDEPEQIEIDAFDREEPDPQRDAEGEEEEEDAATEGDEARAETLVVILTVLAPKGERLEGAALRAAFEAQGLRHGADRIFHRYPDAAPASVGPLFSAVNIVEPGVFELDSMDSMRTPGVGLFMRLPGPKDPGDAFAEMIETARALANTLEAQLCDETRNQLTAQALNHLRGQIADFGRRRLLRV